MGWTKKQLADHWFEWLVGAIMVATGTWATIWAAILDWGPAIILVAAGFGVLILVTINQLYIIKQRWTRNFTNMHSRKIESVLSGWLYRRGFQVAPSPQPSQANALFVFIATYEDRSVSIAQFSGSKAYLTLGAGLELSEEQKISWLGISPTRRKRIIHDFKINLVLLGVMYKDVKDPLDKITLLHQIPCDQSLNEEKLLQAILLLHRGLVLSRQFIQREVLIGSTPDTEDSQTEQV